MNVQKLPKKKCDSHRRMTKQNMNQKYMKELLIEQEQEKQKYSLFEGLQEQNKEERWRNSGQRDILDEKLAIPKCSNLKEKIQRNGNFQYQRANILQKKKPRKMGTSPQVKWNSPNNSSHSSQKNRLAHRHLRRPRPPQMSREQRHFVAQSIHPEQAVSEIDRDFEMIESIIEKVIQQECSEERRIVQEVIIGYLEGSGIPYVETESHMQSEEEIPFQNSSQELELNSSSQYSY